MARRILICGSRDFSDWNALKKITDTFVDGDVLIEGEAHGADRMSRWLIEQRKKAGLKVEILSYPADWKKYGKSAGPTRNLQMLFEGKPDIVYAFYSSKTPSRGTSHMVSISKAKGVKVVEIFPE
jgi:hypothetical protein